MTFTLEWPTSDVRIQSGTEVSLYGYVQDGQIGEELKVQIRHLESGQYWRPDGSFGDAQNHLAAVVDSSGHWRLMHTPQASGEYELVVQYNDSQERTNIQSTTFNVIGQTFVDPFARPLEPLDNPSPDLDLTNSEIIEPVDEQLLQNTETQKQALIQDQNRSASKSENERLNDTNSTKHNKTLKELGSEETLMIIGQTFQQEYQDFITGTGITPAGSSHYATFYLGKIEQGDDTPNLRFLDYVADNNLGNYALVALSLKDNTMAGGYGQMTNNEQSNFNPNAVHDALLDITNGKWDNQIDQFANSMANRPETHFLVRVGYEVSLLLFGYQGEEYVVDWLNEKSSSGINVFDDPSQVEEINPSTYINAYNYVAERIGSKASNVEFGYHPVRGYSDTKFLYPGQENVDWVGFSVFNNDVGMEVNGTFNANGATIDPNLAKSIEFARDNGHEIVIAEAAAQYPATSNPDQFIKYLDRLDDLIINYDVKALSYINSNWPSKGWGPEWGDSRIEEEAQVKDYFLSTFGNNTRYLGMDDLDKEISFNLMATPTEISNPLTV